MEAKAPALILVAALFALSISSANAAELAKPAAAGPGGAVEALFVFGDSYWDIGNNIYGLPFDVKLVVNVPPYDLDYIPASGRLSNGKLVTDFIADLMGIPTPPSSRKPLVNAKKGLNFASIASTATDYMAKYTYVLGEQVADYKKFKAKVDSNTLPDFLSLVPTPDVVSNGLFIVSTGWIDYGLAAATYLSVNTSNGSSPQGMSTTPWKAVFDITRNDPAVAAELMAAEKAAKRGLTTAQLLGFVPFLVDTIKNVVGNISDNVEDLISNGARRIIITGAPAVGCAPIVRGIFNITNPKRCSALVNGLYMVHNKVLKVTVKRLQKKHKGTVLVFANMFDTILELSKSSSKAGVKYTNYACCGAPAPYNWGTFCLGQYKHKNGTKENTNLCDTRTDYLYWDFAHPSETLHKFLSTLFWSGNSKTEMIPYNIQTMIEKKP